MTIIQSFSVAAQQHLKPFFGFERPPVSGSVKVRRVASAKVSVGSVVSLLAAKLNSLPGERFTPQGACRGNWMTFSCSLCLGTVRPLSDSVAVENACKPYVSRELGRHRNNDNSQGKDLRGERVGGCRHPPALVEMETAMSDRWDIAVWPGSPRAPRRWDLPRRPDTWGSGAHAGAGWSAPRSGRN